MNEHRSLGVDRRRFLCTIGRGAAASAIAPALLSSSASAAPAGPSWKMRREILDGRINLDLENKAPG